ncbi:E3 ubiquitin-protein ligase BRE1-like 1 [Diospyros lotus]|uniref:E3 ubiquitin-protein ligase BRE1-like 1 n=1 Tax=Diospyros lotus TaxID=55363 RepID=UPI00225B5B71|nr:E3 ubiquitin-protein ligase BRE1-like 1 [Diospyros lotus]
MGSTGEPDRKRRHFNSISPTAATAKKQPFLPLSEEKKLDTTVLQYQNQKLVQKLEAQKVECAVLENKFSQLKEKQQAYDENIALVNRAWKELINGLESFSSTEQLINGVQEAKTQLITEALSPPEDAFLIRLLETGATESSSASKPMDQNDRETSTGNEKSQNILRNLVSAIDDLWCLKDALHESNLKAIPEDDSSRRKESTDLLDDITTLRAKLGDLHLSHRKLSWELQCHLDCDAKNKAEIKRLKTELDSTVAELDESNSKLASLRADMDAAKGALFPVLNLVNKQAAVDKTKDKQKDLQDMESALKELLDQTSCQLHELKHLHEERIGILKHLSDLQNTVKNLNGISSSQPYVLLREQLAKSKADLFHYLALFEKLQADKDSLALGEKEMNMRNDLLDILQRNSAITESRITEFGIEIQKQISEQNLIENRLEDAFREPGRKKIIAEFKALVSSFPEDMGSMQSQLSKYKDAASDIHSLRADAQSLSIVLNRKANELGKLSASSADQVTEVQKLESKVHDLKECDQELKLFLEMYRRESTDSRDMSEARDSEYQARAHVQSLKSSLDEHNLESQVKAAIEDEAITQQRLAAAEAEIANLREKSEGSKRENSRLSDVLKSKHEENEAYLSEIESISQGYDDMQTRNQQLLLQITERDDYNIKLVLEGVQARQLRDLLVLEKQFMEKEIQQDKESVIFCEMKITRLEDQLKMSSDQIQKLAEDRVQGLANLEIVQKKMLDVQKSCQPLRETLDTLQSKVEQSRSALVSLEIELEKERFEKKRLEEELEVARRKALRLRSQTEGSSIVEKLQEELKEYREILKCSICLERPKEVVITKCYHLFCNPCIQRILETRHRKCPVCSASFGPNDVKPVYI